MSLDDTAKTVWQTARPPLGMLVAGRAAEIFWEPLPPDARAAFEALSEALEGWWPRRKRDPEDIYNKEFVACVTAVTADPEHSKVGRPALNAAYVQLAHLLKVKPRSLPGDGFYDLGEEDFVAVVRLAAKTSRLPLAQLDARLKMLLERKKEPWPDLVTRVRRMHWGKGPAWGKLDKRIKNLAALADLGATASWSQVGAQHALRLELDDVKRITVLKPEELEALRAVIPSIPAPPESA